MVAIFNILVYYIQRIFKNWFLFQFFWRICMNYALSKKKAKELLTAKLSHFMGVTPEEATDEQ